MYHKYVLKMEHCEGVECLLEMHNVQPDTEAMQDPERKCPDEKTESGKPGWDWRGDPRVGSRRRRQRGSGIRIWISLRDHRSASHTVDSPAPGERLEGNEGQCFWGQTV